MPEISLDLYNALVDFYNARIDLYENTVEDIDELDDAFQSAISRLYQECSEEFRHD